LFFVFRLENITFYFREINSNDDALSHLHIDRSFITSTRENVDASIENDRRPGSSNPGDKLHRVRYRTILRGEYTSFFFLQRNPVTVRQEIQSFDDLIPETTLSDIQLNEMPGLQNTGRYSSVNQIEFVLRFQ